MGLQLYHGATRGLAARAPSALGPVLGNPVRLVIPPGVRTGLVVPLYPQGVRVVIAGHPHARHVALGHPAVGPVARLLTAARRDDDDRLRHDDHRSVLDDVVAPLIAIPAVADG